MIDWVDTFPVLTPETSVLGDDVAETSPGVEHEMVPSEAFLPPNVRVKHLSSPTPRSNDRPMWTSCILTGRPLGLVTGSDAATSPLLHTPHNLYVPLTSRQFECVLAFPYT